MATIYIVNHSIGGAPTQLFSSYHHTESEAADAFDDYKSSVGMDYCLIELIRLDTETLDATTITGWEGSSDDIEEEEDEESWSRATDPEPW